MSKTLLSRIGLVGWVLLVGLLAAGSALLLVVYQGEKEQKRLREQEQTDIEFKSLLEQAREAK
jgi:hypothetical protein